MIQYEITFTHRLNGKVVADTQWISNPAHLPALTKAEASSCLAEDNQYNVVEILAISLLSPVEAQEATQDVPTTKDIEVLEAVEHAHTLNLEPSEAFLHEYKYQTLFNPQVPEEFKEALHQLMENEEEKPMIEKVYLLHDHLYRSLSEIPASCLDGTDRPREYWIINGDEDVLYSSYEEAVEESQA